MNLQYTVSVELGNLDSQSFESLELKIRDGMFQAGRELMLQLWNLWVENFKLRNPKAKSAGRKEASFKTAVGELRHARLRVIQDGRFFVPLDEWTSVSSRERATPGFLARLEASVVNVPYRQATSLIEIETGVKQTAMSSWRQTQRRAQLIREDQNRARKKVSSIHESPKIRSYAEKTWREDPNVLDPKCPILNIEADATYCKNQDKLGLKHEVKVAILYTKKEKISRSGKPRFRIQDKLTLIQEYDESLLQFQTRIGQTARAYFGATNKTVLLVRGDGDPWIQDIAHDQFHGAIYFLDPWHVQKKLREAVGPDEFERFRHFVHRCDPDGLSLALRKIFIEPDLESLRERGAVVLHPKKLDQIQLFLQYVENNREGLLRRPELKPLRAVFPGMLCRGSGAMERTIDQLVGERCKRKRMAWSRSGLDNLLLLRKNQINRQYGSTLRTYPVQVSISPLGSPT